MEKRKIGPLECLVRPALNKPKTHFFIQHGYGASSDDLAPLADYLDPERDFTWVFPNAPLAIPGFPLLGGGRAWFPIDMAALELAMQSGQHRDFANFTPPGFLESAQLIQEALQAYGEPLEQIGLGGFSQGAMMSCEVALALKHPLKALIILSGNPVCIERWEENSLKNHPEPGLAIFQSHGTSDPLLSFKAAQDLSELLRQWGHRNLFHPFQAGHEIPLPILSQLREWIGQQCL